LLESILATNARILALDTRFPDLQLLHLSAMLQPVTHVLGQYAAAVSVSHYAAFYHLLNAMITRRRQTMLPLIVTIQVCIREMLTILARDSLVYTAAAAAASEREECTRLLVRLYDSVGFHRSQLQLNKYTVAFIADYLQVLQHYAFPPQIKQLLDQGVIALLDISDQFAYEELNAALNPTGRALFRHLYSTYEKNRYTGKV
jgi:hypothetical protein